MTTLQIPTPIPWHVFLKSGSHASSQDKRPASVHMILHESLSLLHSQGWPAMRTSTPASGCSESPQWTLCKTQCVLFCGYLHTPKRFPGYAFHSHTPFSTITNGNRIYAAEITEWKISSWEHQQGKTVGLQEKTPHTIMLFYTVPQTFWVLYDTLPF